jgi:hypothetical protein
MGTFHAVHANKTPNLVHYSGYSSTEIRPVVRLMIDYLARKEILHDAFFKKYAAKKYMKASIIVRDWIRTEYAEEEITKVTMQTVEMEQVEEDLGQENTPEEDDIDTLNDGNENENECSDVDDFMYANELEEHEV